MLISRKRRNLKMRIFDKFFFRIEFFTDFHFMFSFYRENCIQIPNWLSMNFELFISSIDSVERVPFNVLPTWIKREELKNTKCITEKVLQFTIYWKLLNETINKPNKSMLSILLRTKLTNYKQILIIRMNYYFIHHTSFNFTNNNFFYLCFSINGLLSTTMNGRNENEERNKHQTHLSLPSLVVFKITWKKKRKT